MRWLIALLACTIGAPASAQSWATRDVCLLDKAQVHEEAFDPNFYAEMQSIGTEMANGTGRFWRITTSQGAVSYLWGTLHSNLPIILDLPAPVIQQIETARVVATEKDATTATRYELYKANTDDPYIDNKTIDTVDLGISLETESWIRQRLAGLGWGHQAYALLKPTKIAEILLSAPCDDFASWVYPIQDNRIQMLGAIAGAEVLGLEPANAFRDKLDAEPDNDLVAAIIATYAAYLDPSITPEEYATSYAFYLQGQIGQMMAWEKLFMEQAFPEKGAEWLRRTDDYLLVERNQNFLEAVRPELQEGGVFMAIGSFHLPLETGMIALLRRDGFQVDRIMLEGEAPG